MKRCNRCRIERSLDDFFLNHKEADHHQKTCKECQLQMQRDKRARISDGTWRPQKKLQHPRGKKICTNCETVHPATTKFFVPMKAAQRGLSPACRSCINQGRKTRRHTMPWSKRLVEYVNGPRHTSRTTDPFDLTTEFLEMMFTKQEGRCAWTGVKMTTDIGSDRLRIITLDRLNNSRGYTSDNVALVCKAANQARGDASVEEFVRFLDDVRG